jgi:hypothetical protein
MNTATVAAARGSHLLADGNFWLRAFEAPKDRARAPIPLARNRAPPHGKVRSKVEPRDIPPIKAARRLHLTLEEFRDKLPELQARGFPEPDPTTGMFDLKAIDTWADTRNPRLFKMDAETDTKKDARQVVKERLQRFGEPDGKR